MRISSPIPRTVCSHRQASLSRSIENTLYAAPAHKRKCDGINCQRPVAAQIISPDFSETTVRGARMGVVIAGDDGDMFGRAAALKPRTGRRKFRLQRDVDEIAGNGDVVGAL